MERGDVTREVMENVWEAGGATEWTENEPNLHKKKKEKRVGLKSKKEGNHTVFLHSGGKEDAPHIKQ